MQLTANIIIIIRYYTFDRVSRILGYFLRCCLMFIRSLLMLIITDHHQTFSNSSYKSQEHSLKNSMLLIKYCHILWRLPLIFRYLEYVKDLVYSNLSQSQPGGVPGTAKLVQSYLKLKHASAIPGLEVGTW